jgi:hypothetical protein
MMKDSYNDFSELQRAGAEKALETLISLLFPAAGSDENHLKDLRNKRRLTVGDFG